MQFMFLDLLREKCYDHTSAFIFDWILRWTRFQSYHAMQREKTGMAGNGGELFLKAFRRLDISQRFCQSVLVYGLMGRDHVTEDILLESFLRSLGDDKGAVIRNALSASEFSSEIREDLIENLGRCGVRQLLHQPTLNIGQEGMQSWFAWRGHIFLSTPQNWEDFHVS